MKMTKEEALKKIRGTSTSAFETEDDIQAKREKAIAKIRGTSTDVPSVSASKYSKASREEKYAIDHIKGVKESSLIIDPNPSKFNPVKAEREDKYATESIKGDNSGLFDQLYPDAPEMQRRDYNFKQVFGENGERLDYLPDTDYNKVLKTAVSAVVPSQMDVPALNDAIERAQNAADRERVTVENDVLAETIEKNDKNIDYLKQTKSEKFPAFVQGLSYDALKDIADGYYKGYTADDVVALKAEKYYRDYEHPFSLLEKQYIDKFKEIGDDWETSITMNPEAANYYLGYIYEAQDALKEELKRAGYNINDEEFEEYINIAKRLANDEEFEKMKKEIKDAGFWERVGYNIASIPANLTGLPGQIVTTAQAYGNANRANDSYRPIDYNSPELRGVQFAREVRKDTAEKLNNDVLEFVYGSGMSILDSTLSGVVGGKHFAPLLLSSSAGINAMYDAKERGLSDLDAVNLGVAASINEFVFEKVSIDNFFEGFDKNITRRSIAIVLKQAGVEGFEEVATSIANALADQGISGENSALNLAVEEYIKDGKSQTEARRLALNDFMLELGVDYLGGALSGSVFGTVEATMTHSTRKAAREAKKIENDLISRQTAGMSAAEKELYLGAREAVRDYDESAEKESAPLAVDPENPTNSSRKGSLSDNSISEIDENVNRENDTKKFSIKYTKDNRKYVSISDDILAGVDEKDYVSTVKSAIAKFKPAIPIGGRLIKVNKITQNEYTHSKDTKVKKTHNKAVYKDKLTAAGKLDEIVLASDNYVNEALNHPRKDNIKQFARGNVLLDIGGNKYSASVIVGFTSNNEMLLYDVIDMNTTKFSVKTTDNNSGTVEMTSENNDIVNKRKQVRDQFYYDTIYNSFVRNGTDVDTAEFGARAIVNALDGKLSRTEAVEIANNKTLLDAFNVYLDTNITASENAANEVLRASEARKAAEVQRRETLVEKMSGMSDEAIVTFEKANVPAEYADDFLAYYTAGLAGSSLREANRQNKSLMPKTFKELAMHLGRADMNPKSTRAVYATNPGFAENEYSARVDSETKAELDRIGKDLGVSIEMGPATGDSGDNGFYSAGRIVIAEDAADPFRVVAAHEVTHRLFVAEYKEARAYSEYVTRKMYSRGTLNNAVNDIITNRKANGYELTRAEAVEEIVSNYTKRMLDDVDLFYELSHKKPNIAKRLLYGLKEFLSKIKSKFTGNKNLDSYGLSHSELRRAAELWSEAYNRAMTDAAKTADNKNTAVYDSGESESDVKHSVKENVAFSEDQIMENCGVLVTMENVAELTGDELSGDAPLREKIETLFKGYGNNVYTEQFGDVELNTASIRSDIRHGTTRAKVSSYAAIPDVLKKGTVINEVSKNQGRVKRIVVAAPIAIGKTNYYMGVMLQRDANKQRLYLHDVVIKKEVSENSAAILNTTGTADSENLFLTDILERAVSVGNSIHQNNNIVKRSSKKDTTTPTDTSEYRGYDGAVKLASERVTKRKTFGIISEEGADALSEYTGVNRGEISKLISIYKKADVPNHNDRIDAVNQLVARTYFVVNMSVMNDFGIDSLEFTPELKRYVDEMANIIVDRITKKDTRNAFAESVNKRRAVVSAYREAAKRAQAEAVMYKKQAAEVRKRHDSAVKRASQVQEREAKAIRERNEKLLQARYEAKKTTLLKLMDRLFHAKKVSPEFKAKIAKIKKDFDLENFDTKHKRIERADTTLIHGLKQIYSNAVSLDSSLYSRDIDSIIENTDGLILAQLSTEEAKALSSALKTLKSSGKLTASKNKVISEYIEKLDNYKPLTGTSKNLNALKEIYEELVAENPDFQDTYIEGIIGTIDSKHIDDLDEWQINTLTKVLSKLAHDIKLAQTDAFVGMDGMPTVTDAALSEINVVRNAVAFDDIENKWGRGKRSAAAEWSLNAIANNFLTPESGIKRLTGYDENSFLLKLTRALDDGQLDVERYKIAAEEKFSKFTENKKFMDSLYKKKITVDGHDIPLGFAISLYLHSKNDDNMRHIERGGISLPNFNAFTRKINYANAKWSNRVRLTKAKIESMARSFTNEEIAFANEVADYFDHMNKDAINKISVLLNGYEKADVTFYFPISTDKNFMTQSFIVTPEGGLPTFEFPNLKDRRLNAGNPALLFNVVDVLARSVENTSMYYGLAVPMHNFKTLYNSTVAEHDTGIVSRIMGAEDDQNYVARQLSGLAEEKSLIGVQSLKDTIERKWGKDGKEFIDDFLIDLGPQNKKGGKARDFGDKAVSWIMGNYAKNALTLNLSSTFIQTSGLMAAGSVLDIKNVTKAYKTVLTGPKAKKLDELIKKHTPMLEMRKKGYSEMELGDVSNNFKKSAVQNAYDNIMSHKALDWMTDMDLWTARRVWVAAEYHTKANYKHLEYGSEAYYKQVAKSFNEAIRKTQPNSTAMERPRIMRRNSAILSFMTFFKSQAFANFNCVYDALNELRVTAFKMKYTTPANSVSAITDRKAKIKQLEHRLGNVLAAQVLQQLITEIMRFGVKMLRGDRDDYEEEDGLMTLNSALSGIAGNFAVSMFEPIPFISTLANAIDSASKYGPDKLYQVFMPMYSERVEDVLEITFKFADSLKNEDGEYTFNVFGKQGQKMLESFATFMGVPVSNIKKDLNLLPKLFAEFNAGGGYAGDFAALGMTGELYYTNKNGVKKISSEAAEIAAYAYYNDREAYEYIISELEKSRCNYGSTLRSKIKDLYKNGKVTPQS